MNTQRPISEAAESRLGVKVPLLDYGFVTPVDYMGTDLCIVQAARASYGPSPKSKQDDRTLLRYLLRHRHTTPFEMCEVKFLCRMPIFVARQWIRHRTANVNEMSLRYSEPIWEFYVPQASALALQAKDNKQGREMMPLPPDVAARVQDFMQRRYEDDQRMYGWLEDEIGLAKELARMHLPVSLYTQWIWKIDLHNLMHFLSLRLDSHAQYEIRVFAQAMADFVAAWVPWSWEAFNDYKREAQTFSRQEQDALAWIYANGPTHTGCLSHMIDDALTASGLSGREAKEAEVKLRALFDRKVAS